MLRFPLRLSRSSLNSVRGFSALILATILALTIAPVTVSNAQETSALSLEPAPAIPLDLYPAGQPFLSLLDDVTIGSDPTPEVHFSFVDRCELNAPKEFALKKFDAKVIAGGPPEEAQDEWATLFTYTCNDKTCKDCSELTFTNSSDTRSAESCKPETYCDQICQLLATTLKSSEASFDAKISATKSAMKMVAEKTTADAEMQIAELKAAHQKEINLLQDELALARNQTESLSQIMSWLRPIYTNQNRNYQQLQELAAMQEKRALEDSVKVEKPVLKKLKPTINRNLLPSSAQMASKALAEKNREAEIARLKSELKLIDGRLSRLVAQPTRRASHLEPVYVPKGQLVPIRDVPQRQSLSDRLEPTQRIRPLR